MNANTDSLPLLTGDSAIRRRHVCRLKSCSRDDECGIDMMDLLRNIIIGFSDGLTVPFALTAGLSTLGSSKIVIMGGLAELFSGMISMGLGAYLAAITECDHYSSHEEWERERLERIPDQQRAEILCVLDKYNVSRTTAETLVKEICKNHELWVQFMMDFSLRIEHHKTKRAWVSGVTMGLSYLIGGLIPMVPYFILPRVSEGLLVSVVVSAIVLVVFGYMKGYVATRSRRAGVRGALQTLIIGAFAAGTSYVIVSLLDTKS